MPNSTLTPFKTLQKEQKNQTADFEYDERKLEKQSWDSNYTNEKQPQSKTPLASTGSISFRKPTELLAKATGALVSEGTDLTKGLFDAGVSLFREEMFFHKKTEAELKAEQKAANKKAEAMAQAQVSSRFFADIKPSVWTEKKVQVVAGKAMSVEDVQGLLGNATDYKGNLDYKGEVNTYSKIAAGVKLDETTAQGLRRKKQEAMAALKSKGKSGDGATNMDRAGENAVQHVTKRAS